MATAAETPVAAPPVTTPNLSSQEIIDDFWKANLAPEKPITKPPTVLPRSVYDRLVGASLARGEIKAQSVGVSYQAAVKECEEKVAAIVAECRRNNLKYSDPHFDLDDFDYCLKPLSADTTPASDDDPASDSQITYTVTQKATSTGKPISWGNIQPDSASQSADESTKRLPACAKRVGDIFDAPQFYVHRDAHVKDLRQGAEGDCWFISSLGCLAVDKQFPALIEKMCPANARDEKVGVYGFVFFRDGEWISEVIDDKLYIKAPDYDDCDDERRKVWDASHSRLDPAVSREEYRKTFQSNSDALFFGSCANPNETWVPLIEKAFAKAHGDYEALDGGWPGEGIEDLTGGVTTEIVTADILDKDEFWKNGLMKVNKEFLFSTGTREYAYLDPLQLGRQGIQDGHSYSLLRAAEYKGQRLCLAKNPWGESEWTGPWSDGSSQWTPEALEALNHKFGNEGIFWMPFEDFLRRNWTIWRTRLFSADWKVAQHWTTLQVPWSGEYNDTKFEFTLPVANKTVIVLSQLDSRYFGGLTGQYMFELAFRVHKSGESKYIVRGYSSGDRSASTEVFLEAGTYEVLPQISGYRDTSLPKVEDVVKTNWLERREKLMRIGLSYDLANSKGLDGKEKENPGPAKPVAPTEPVTKSASTTVSSADGSDTTTPAPEDPWNAVCVVGLRVFAEDTTATIRAIKQSPSDLETSKKLDVDDAEKTISPE